MIDEDLQMKASYCEAGDIDLGLIRSFACHSRYYYYYYYYYYYFYY